MENDNIQPLNALTGQAENKVAYQPLCDRRDSVPAPPRFTFGDAPHDLMRRYYSETLCLPVGLYAAAGLGVFNSSMLLRGETILHLDEIQMHRGMLQYYIDHYRKVSGSIRIRDEPGQCVLLLGPGYGIYGHWLVDFLPKLFVLHKAGLDVTKLRYLVPDNTPAFGIALLDLLGITAGMRVIYNSDLEVLRAEELLIPTMVRTNSRTSPLFADAVRFAASLIWSRIPKPAIPDGMSRIFVSRGRAGRDGRRLLNRGRIEQMAAEAGFRVVSPEEMPLIEQFALFSQARQIIGEYGSAMHASLFSPPGTVIGLLRGTGSPIAGFLQSALGEALAQPTGYIFGETVADDPLECFTVAENAFQTCLSLIFGGNVLTEAISP